MLENSQFIGNCFVSWLTESKILINLGKSRTSLIGNLVLFCLINESPIPTIGREDPFLITTKSVLKYYQISANIPGLLAIWFEAPVSNVHSVSTTVLSSVRAASACGISLSWVVFCLGIH